ncbi:MAG: hypothetical protein IPO78_17350 [Saprospiraceae bacterium]|nr:hypothetical protein [Saprospiraceae bacterium]
METKIERNILLFVLFIAIGYPLIATGVFKLLEIKIDWLVVFAPHLMTLGAIVIHVLLDWKNIFK